MRRRAQEGPGGRLPELAGPDTAGSVPLHIRRPVFPRYGPGHIRRRRAHRPGNRHALYVHPLLRSGGAGHAADSGFPV